jgi:uncharacterized protein (DUF1499 family)
MIIRFRTILAALAVLAAVSAFAPAGLERLWMLSGPADLGPVTFETLERRATPNDALACPPGVCRAASDMTPPLFTVSAEELRRALARVIASEANIVQVESTPLAERYIQRTRWLRFPDTIAVRYFSRGERQSTIALYSRSQLGEGDLGVNRARIARWLDKLAREAPPIQATGLAAARTSLGAKD